MAWWGSLAFKLKAWAIAVGAGIAAFIGVYFYGRKSGSLQEMNRQAEEDRKKARSIEDAADRVRRADGDNVDPVERLSKYKKLRDI